jgi:hypothetical protein
MERAITQEPKVKSRPKLLLVNLPPFLLSFQSLYPYVYPMLLLTKEPKKDGSHEGSDKDHPLVSPTSASWRPDFNRQQSWSMQDRKRAMQSPLMSPTEEQGSSVGFTTTGEDGEGVSGRGQESGEK